MPRALLIYNPAAGSRRQRTLPQEIAAILGAAGIEVDLQPTASAAEATAAARRSAETGRVDRIFTLGGDGTLRAAAQGLLGRDVALAPLPAGTTNVVARCLGLSQGARHAADVLLDAESLECDVGLCTDATGRTEVFLMQASLGLDAAIMAAVSSRAKRLGGRAAVALLGLPTWWRYPYPEIRYRADGAAGRAIHLVAANIPHYGGDFRIAPDAGFDTHRLHLVTFAGRGRLAALAFARDLLGGRHTKRPDVSCRTVSEVIVEAPLEAPLQLDGDALSMTAPLTLRLAEKRLRLAKPRLASGPGEEGVSGAGR